MYTIVIIIGIAIFIACYDEYKNGFYSDWTDYVLKTIIGCFIGVFAGFLIAFTLPAKTEIIKTTYTLELLQDNNSVKGNFFLGCGQIEGKLKYVFYYERNGFYKLAQINYENVSIKYSDEKPKVEEFEQEYVKDAFINNFAIDCNSYQEYIIHVPKGTIKQNYTLDAQ